MPDHETSRADLRGIFQLRPQERSNQLARQEGGAHVHPGVLVHLAPEELGTVSAFLPDDLGTLGKLRIVDEQRAALAGYHVLGLVEAQGREVADGAERLALVAGV